MVSGTRRILAIRGILYPGGLNDLSRVVIRILLSASLITFAGPGLARPLVTSSEDTLARVCLAREETPERIIAACDAALAEAGLTDAQRVEMTIARADGFLWMEDPAAAEAGYRAAIEIDPRSSEAWNGLGWALRDSRGDSAALEAFETSLSIEVSVQGLGGKAATARETGAMSNEEARAMLRAALTIDPEYLWALREIAWSHLDDDQPGDAAAVFEEALALDPDDVNARYGLGRSVLAAGDALRALTMFNEVLADVPDDMATRVYRIIALRELDRNAQALRDADRLISEFPDRSSGYIERGLSLMALERRAEALATFEHAEAELGPSNALLYWHADALAADGRFEAALEVIDRALAMEGANASDHLLKSYIALELKDYPLTRAAAETALETGEESPWAHYYIAITMVHSGETAEALSRFDRAMETGLPDHRVGALAKELIGAGKYIEAAQLRIRY